MSLRTSTICGVTPVVGLALLFLSSTAAAQTTFNTNIRVGFQAGDDWEPSLLADSAGHLYVVVTHLADSPPQTSCPGCASHFLVQRSDDGGDTWTAPVMIDPVVRSQFDPWLQLDPNGTTVWFSYMNNVNPSTGPIDIVNSATWSTPVTTLIGSVLTQPKGFSRSRPRVRLLRQELRRGVSAG